MHTKGVNELVGGAAISTWHDAIFNQKWLWAGQKNEFWTLSASTMPTSAHISRGCCYSLALLLWDERRMLYSICGTTIAKKNYGWCHVNSKLMSLISIGILLCPTGSSDNLWSRVKFVILCCIHIESVSQFTNRPDHKNVCASIKNV